MSLVTTAMSLCARSALHRASISAGLPEPTGPATPTRRGPEEVDDAFFMAWWLLRGLAGAEDRGSSGSGSEQTGVLRLVGRRQQGQARRGAAHVVVIQAPRLVDGDGARRRGARQDAHPGAQAARHQAAGGAG